MNTSSLFIWEAGVRERGSVDERRTEVMVSGYDADLNSVGVYVS